MKVALITGITGQDGSYLSEFLLEKNYKIYGIIRRSSSLNTHRIDHIFDKLNLRYGDLCDTTSITSILHEISLLDPSVLEVYNLGAMSHVKISFEMPEYTGNIDGLGTLRILECLRTCKIPISKIKFYQASTSELYGKVLETPQSEKTPFNPQSPYAVAKMYGFYITKNYRESYNMFACNGILFNHESPRRGETFVTRKITRALGNIVKTPLNNTVKPLVMGNINSLRDWGHAKDYIEGMWMMLQNNVPEDIVLATGEMHSVREFIEKSFSMRDLHITWSGHGIEEQGIDQYGRILIKISEKYFRPSEVDLLLGDAAKANKILGWKPSTSFNELVKEMVDADCPL